jgi:hypothetical protein
MSTNLKPNYAEEPVYAAPEAGLREKTPDTNQMSKWKLFFAWSGIASAMFFVYIGAALATAYGPLNTVIGIGLTVVAYWFINAILSKYAVENRTTVAMFSRTILGRTGASIATIIFALVAIYYSVFEGSIVAVAFQAQFGGELWFWSLIVVLYTTPLVIGGVRKFLDKLCGVLLPVYFFGLIAAIIWASVKYDGIHVAPAVPMLPFTSGGPGWLAVFVSYMGVWIMMMYTMDYAALGKKKDVKFHQNITFGWFFYAFAYGFAAAAGMILSYSIPGFEITEGGVAVGIVGMMGFLGLIIIWASQTRINTANYYLGSANLQDFVQRIFKIKAPYAVFVIANGVIVYLLMMLPVIQYILIALAWQGVLVTAWVAIAVTHILLNKGKTQERGDIPDDHYASVNPAGLISWIVATAIGIAMLQLQYISPELAGVGATWGPIATALIASVLYTAIRNSSSFKTALLPKHKKNALQTGEYRATA